MSELDVCIIDYCRLGLRFYLQLLNRTQCDLFAFLLLLPLGEVFIVTSLLGGILSDNALLLGGVLCNYSLICRIFVNILTRYITNFPMSPGYIIIHFSFD